MSSERICRVSRRTAETEISVCLSLDGSGRRDITTGVPFLDHLLEHLAVHGLLDLEVRCQGDVSVDDHHSVEDIGIVLGQALNEALGDRMGIARYGSQLLPMDETLVLVALDLSGRAFLSYDVPGLPEKVGSFDTELVPEFLRALAHHAGLTLHVQLLHGTNGHHILEAIFKGLGRALGQAVALDPRRAGIPSTKGVL